MADDARIACHRAPSRTCQSGGAGGRRRALAERAAQPRNEDGGRRQWPAIGLVLVTHGQLAAALRAALEHVVGPLEGVATVCIDADDDMETRRRDIRRGAAVDAGQGVIVLTDMFGGTPSIWRFRPRTKPVSR